MKKKTAELLVNAARDMGEFTAEEFSLYEGYSGRGMYGTKTDAVVCDDWMTFCYVATVVVAELAREEDEDDEEDAVEAFQNEMKKLRWDNMGEWVVIY